MSGESSRDSTVFDTLSTVVLKPAAEVLWQVIDSETVLFDMRSDQIYQLSTTGSLLWELIVVGSSEREIVAKIAAEYDVSLEQLIDEVSTVVQSLKGASLVVERD